MTARANSNVQEQQPEPRTADRVRQAVVSASVAISIVGAIFGAGALGGVPVQNAAGGVFSEDATLIAPGSTAFSIWSVIYSGLVAYAIWQWLPRQSAATRHRSIGYWVAASTILNAAWLLSVQAAALWLSLAIMGSLLVVLLVVFSKLRRHPGEGLIDAIVTDGTLGLYLGWILVASFANLASVIAAGSAAELVQSLEPLPIMLVASAGLLGVAVAVWGKGRFAPTAAVCWGLAWVGNARLTGDLVSVPVATTAFIAAGVLLVATIVLRIVAVRRGGPRTGD